MLGTLWSKDNPALQEQEHGAGSQPVTPQRLQGTDSTEGSPLPHSAVRAHLPTSGLPGLGRVPALTKDSPFLGRPGYTVKARSLDPHYSHAWAGGQDGPHATLTFLLRTLSFSTTPSRRLTTESTAGQLLKVFSSSATTMVTWLVSRSMFF